MDDAKKPAPVTRDQPLKPAEQAEIVRDVAPRLMSWLKGEIDGSAPVETTDHDRIMVALNVLAVDVAPLLAQLDERERATWVALVVGLLEKHPQRVQKPAPSSLILPGFGTNGARGRG